MILVKRGLAGGGEPQSVFDEYVKCLLNALNLTLENKNHKYEHNCERWLFMMNNYHFIKERLLDGHKDAEPMRRRRVAASTITVSPQLPPGKVSGRRG